MKITQFVHLLQVALVVPRDAVFLFPCTAAEYIKAVYMDQVKIFDESTHTAESLWRWLYAAYKCTH